jgi:hypothetical protein
MVGSWVFVTVITELEVRLVREDVPVGRLESEESET